MENLRIIGEQLDRNIFPHVKNGGIVIPSTISPPSMSLGEEHQNERQKRKRPTPPWTQPSRRQRTTCKAPSVISSYLKGKYQKELAAIESTYPGTQVWHQEKGLWLMTESSLLPDQCRKAIFLTAIPYVWPYTIRSWGFWKDVLLAKAQWIGPRHTNFPDGSICAFEPTDESWSHKDSIVELLDIYTLWALRHFHLEFFGRWPGRQVVHYSYERMTELNDSELCGCGNSTQKYKECCKTKDIALNKIAEMARFDAYTGGSQRIPPKAIVKVIVEQEAPPCISTIMSY
ncbi:MAG TPA: hypothetical protein DCX54_02015 [Flavobacteriales bacterium]|nr:hypothetical protein [Flavobacteriales bacterium]